MWNKTLLFHYKKYFLINFVILLNKTLFLNKKSLIKMHNAHNLSRFSFFLERLFSNRYSARELCTLTLLSLLVAPSIVEKDKHSKVFFREKCESWICRRKLMTQNSLNLSFFFRRANFCKDWFSHKVSLMMFLGSNFMSHSKARLTQQKFSNPIHHYLGARRKLMHLLTVFTK